MPAELFAFARPGRAARRVRPVIETLECRSLLTGNLWITNAELVNAAEQPITAPVVGEQVFVEAQWMSSGLSGSDAYTVRYSVDGVTLNSSTIAGQSGDNLPFHWYIGGWLATAGSHTVEVTIDPDHTVAETTYGDNSTSFSFAPAQPANLPQKLILPIAGVPFQNWSVANYIDVNPLAGVANDYRGGSFVYDDHDGYDFALPDFAQMDAGMPVMSAASGTITEVVEGNFDRQTAFTSDDANEVVEDLGNGWTAEYLHFMNRSITVQVGQTVQAGQLLGLAGSSGHSTMAHLHFDLRHDGDLVETFDEPGAYWVNPLPYQGDVPPSITDQGTTHSEPTADLNERPDSVTVFPSSSGWAVWYWFDISYLHAGDQMAITWYRPDGSLAVSDPYTESSFVDHGSFAFDLTLPPSVWAADPGTWQVAAVVNGTELGRTGFQITNGAGDPTIKVEQGSTYILDNRTTPIDFGTVSQSWTGPELAFTVENIGSSPLTTGGLSVPTGFTLVGSFPATIPAGAAGTFTVQLSSASVGSQFGQVTFQTNDPNAPTFGFNVSGMVAGSPPAGAPQIQLSGAALATGLGSGPLVLDAGATLTDSSPQGFDGGSLTIAMASGGAGDDRLSILNQGSASGQIGFNGSGVTFGSTQIGTASSSAGPATLSVALNTSATLAAVQALLDDITYQNVATLPTTAPRYVRFSVVDGARLASNLAVEMVVNSGAAIASPPRSPGPILSPPPTPSPTGPLPLRPGSAPSLPGSVASLTPPPAPSPVDSGSAKKKHPAAPEHVKHKRPASAHHRSRPAGHAKGSTRKLKDRRGEARKRSKHGGS